MIRIHKNSNSDLSVCRACGIIVLKRVRGKNNTGKGIARIELDAHRCQSFCVRYRAGQSSVTKWKFFNINGKAYEFYCPVQGLTKVLQQTFSWIKSLSAARLYQNKNLNDPFYQSLVCFCFSIKSLWRWKSTKVFKKSPTINHCLELVGPHNLAFAGKQ